MARREKGEGSLYQRASDGRWAATWRDPAGKLRTSYGATKSAASRARDAAKAKAEQAAKDAAAPPVLRLCDWLAIWLRDWKEPNVSITTIMNYERWLKLLKPDPLYTTALMPPVPLETWQTFFAALSKRTPATARNLRTALIDALDVAVDAGHLSVNRVRRTRLPAYTPSRASLSLPQVRMLLNHLAGDRLEVAVWLGLEGLRRGELCGLRWEHIDLETGRAFVCEQVVIVPGGRETRKPKRKKTRWVTFTPQTIAALTHHRDRQRLEALTNARPVPETVLTNTRGKALSPNMLDVWYQGHRDALHLPGTLHSLRRTSSTLAQSAGANIRDVLAQLGHTNLDQTLDYTDSTEAGQRDAATKLSTILPWPKTGS